MEVDVVGIKVVMVCVKIDLEYVMVKVLIIGCIGWVFVIEGVLVGKSEVMYLVMIE